MSRARIVVVEDDADIREILEYTLSREGFAVTCIDDGVRGLSEVKSVLPDLVILDLMLPGMDGLDICRELKRSEATAKIAIVMLTAKGEEADVVLGLGLGADDYIQKPFRSKELIARLLSVMRRTSGPIPNEDARTVQVGALRLSPEQHRATIDDVVVPLTATEFKILMCLARQPGRVFTRAQILDAARGHMAAATDRSVDAHVRTIRKKLGDQRDLIETVHSIGYRMIES